MNFKESIATSIDKCITFAGRSSRFDFWSWLLFLIIVYNVIGFLLPMGWSVFIAQCILLVPTVSVTVRRFHDIDKSGWVQLGLIGAIILSLYIGLATGVASGNSIPSVNYLATVIVLLLILYFIYLTTRPGTKGSNRFGVDPLAVSGENP